MASGLEARWANKQLPRNCNAMLIHRDRVDAGKSVTDLADAIGMSSVVLSMRLKYESLTTAQMDVIAAQMSVNTSRYQRGSS